MKDEKHKQDGGTVENKGKRQWARSAKECACLAVFVALVIAVQVALSFVPGVELVTVMFVAYAFVLGCRRGMIAATLFSLLRQLIFGFYPVVLILYLVYFNLLTLTFGQMGRKMQVKPKNVWVISVVACIGTVCFNMLDNVLTPLFFGYSKKLMKIYFYSSFSFMIPQVICTAVSVTFLFLPLAYVFKSLKKRL